MNHLVSAKKCKHTFSSMLWDAGRLSCTLLRRHPQRCTQCLLKVSRFFPGLIIRLWDNSTFLSWCFALWNYLILLYCELKVYGTIIIVHWLLSFTGFRCLISRLDLFLIKLRSKSLPSESAMMLEHTFSINRLNWSKWLQCNIINTPLNSDDYLRIVSIASNAPLSSQAWKLLGYAILTFTFAV